MDPEDEEDVMVLATVAERCFMCAKNLEIGSYYSNCTKMHLDNYEKYVHKHEVYKHIFNVRFMESCSSEGQFFTTCSGCFEGVDELLFINNQLEELENQVGVLVESLTSEILRNRNRYSECSDMLTDPLEPDPLDTTKIELQSVPKFPLLADIVRAETKVEIEDFECPSPVSPQGTWEMDPDIETEQILPLSPPLICNNVTFQKNCAGANNDSKTNEGTKDIYALVSSREIRIVINKLDTETITNYTKPTAATSWLKVKVENVNPSTDMHDDYSDWNASAEENNSDSDFEISTKDKPRRKLKKDGTKEPKSVSSKERRRVGQEYFSCEICGDKMKPMSRTKFKKHILSHPKYQPYKCTFPNCEVKFRWYYALKIHEKEHISKDDEYNCDICGKQYRGPYELRKHKQRVHVEESEECKICGKKYKLKQGLMVHVKRFHGISHLEYSDKNSVTPFCCDICQQCYSSENTLRTHHLRFHSENIDFFCDFCNENVTPLRSLAYTKIQSSDKILHTIGHVLKCTRKICNAAFNCTEKYKKHKEDHRREGRNRRTKKYTSDGAWATRAKTFVLRGKYPPRIKLPRKSQNKTQLGFESEEMPKELNVNKKKLVGEGKLKKAKTIKIKLFSKETMKKEKSRKKKLPTKKDPNEEDSQTLETVNNSEENLLNEDGSKAEDDNFISENEMPDDDYLLSGDEKNDDADWLSEEEKSKTNKYVKRKRKYKKKTKIGGAITVKPKQKRKKKLIFKCEKCDENFKSEVTLIKHNIKVHQQENSLLSFAKVQKEKQKESSKCEVCGKGFRSQDNLTRHVALHNKVKISPEENLKSYLCDICGRPCKTRLTLKSHKKTHVTFTEEEKEKKWLKCDICGKMLKLRVSLVNHMKNHFDLKLPLEEKLKVSGIICELCGKPMTTPSNLRRHLRQAHNDEKPFKCPHPNCNKSYKDDVNLRKHVEGHQNVAKYQCEVCEKKFFRRDYLLLHIRRNHGATATSKEYQKWRLKSRIISQGSAISDNGVPNNDKAAAATVNKL